jgi:predicted PurR-regulated permease PerM
VVVSIAWFLYSIFDRVLLIFTGVVMAIAIESLISYFEQKTSKRWLAILISYLLLVGLLLSGIIVMVPFLVNQISDLVLIIISWAQELEATLKVSGLQDMIKSIRVYKYLMTFGIDLAEPKYIDYIQTVLQNNISAIVSFSSSYAKDA